METQIFRDNLGERTKDRGECIFRLSESLRSNILATMGPTPDYTAIIINLPF